MDKLILDGRMLLKFINAVIEDQSYFSLFHDLMRSTVFIMDDHINGHTFISLIPKCNCDGCSALRNEIRELANGNCTIDQFRENFKKYNSVSHDYKD